MASRANNLAYYARHRDRIKTKMAARARQNRADAITAAGGVCKQCGQWHHRLQFDHIDPKSKVSHKIWTWSPERRAAELAKCRLLCEPCHIQKTIDNDEHQWKTRVSDV